MKIAPQVHKMEHLLKNVRMKYSMSLLAVWKGWGAVIGRFILCAPRNFTRSDFRQGQA